MVKKEFADKFIAKYKDYDITRKTEYWHENNMEYEGVYLIIKNPLGINGEDIKLMYDGNHVTDREIILSCGKWHTHFFDYYFPKDEKEKFADYFIEDISKCVDAIFQGKDFQEVF
jgi:hypothetical protein